MPLAMIAVSVPATLANLGPGFDVLGMAVSLRNRFEFAESSTWADARGPVDPADHLALHTAMRAAACFGGRVPPLRVSQQEEVPRARGLGSSATARVAGLVAGLHFSGLEISLSDQLDFLAEEEGHPDNVVPAAVGGLTLCGHGPSGRVHERFDAPALQVALCIPDREVSTEAARGLLPPTVPLTDAVHNVSSVAFLLAGLVGGRAEAISWGLSDRLHQPYRKDLIGPVDEAFSAAVAAGATGAFVSGSGSTLAAFVAPDRDASAVAQAMASVFVGVDCVSRVVAPVNEGFRVEQQDA